MFFTSNALSLACFRGIIQTSGNSRVFAQLVARCNRKFSLSLSFLTIARKRMSHMKASNKYSQREIRKNRLSKFVNSKQGLFCQARCAKYDKDMAQLMQKFLVYRQKRKRYFNGAHDELCSLFLGLLCFHVVSPVGTRVCV